MPKPNQPPQQAKRRDPKRTAAGKAVLADIAKGASDAALIGLEDLQDAIYYLDGILFIPSGMGKAARAVRAAAKRRGVL